MYKNVKLKLSLDLLDETNKITIGWHNLIVILILVLYIVYWIPIPNRIKMFFFLLPGFPENGRIRIPVFILWYAPLFTEEEYQMVKKWCKQNVNYEVLFYLLRRYTEFCWYCKDYTLLASSYVAAFNFGNPMVLKFNLGIWTVIIKYQVAITYMGVVISLEC
jgi:hypothetical protein